VKNRKPLHWVTLLAIGQLTMTSSVRGFMETPFEVMMYVLDRQDFFLRVINTYVKCLLCSSMVFLYINMSPENTTTSSSKVHLKVYAWVIGKVLRHLCAQKALRQTHNDHMCAKSFPFDILSILLILLWYPYLNLTSEKNWAPCNSSSRSSIIGMMYLFW
jgi:hypothetical protein